MATTAGGVRGCSWRRGRGTHSALSLGVPPVAPPGDLRLCRLVYLRAGDGNRISVSLAGTRLHLFKRLRALDADLLHPHARRTPRPFGGKHAHKRTVLPRAPCPFPGYCHHPLVRIQTFLVIEKTHRLTGQERHAPRPVSRCNPSSPILSPPVLGSLDHFPVLDDNGPVVLAYLDAPLPGPKQFS